MTEMTDRSPSTPKAPLAIAVSFALLLGMWVWLEARSLASKHDSHAALVRQVEQMNADMLVVRRLRAAPRLATERQRPNDELLAEVRGAMDRAKMPAERWVGHDPSRPVRLPRTPYKRLSTRLAFEDVTLQELVTLSFFLVKNNPALNVSSVRLSAPPAAKKKNWSAELTISYLIYAPFQNTGV